MTDREYLAKPVLPNMKYEITDSRIYIANENTVFIQANNIEKFRQEDILDRYKELLIEWNQKFNLTTIIEENVVQNTIQIVDI